MIACSSMSSKARNEDQKTDTKEEISEEMKKEGIRKVLTGIDVLERDSFKILKGKRIGLITNHSAQNSNGISTVELLSRNTRLVKLFAPEHGIEGSHGKPFPGSWNYDYGIPVISLYSKSKKPSSSDLDDIDALVFDIQSAGARYYTYITTMGYCMEAAAMHNKEFIVLDRPNPAGGNKVSGAVPLKTECKSFICYYSLATQHGMTIGELANMFKEEKKLSLELTVIQMKGWSRSMTYDKTGLSYIPPSPNLKRQESIIPYCILGFLEHSNISVGRGTEYPFEIYGAPFIDEKNMVEELNNFRLKGVEFKEATFIPEGSFYKGKLCKGFRIHISDKSEYEGNEIAMAVLVTLHKLNKHNFKPSNAFNSAFGSRKISNLVFRDTDIKILKHLLMKQNETFLGRRKKYLLY